MKKWTKAEMQEHGFSVDYYSGWGVDLKVPKGLTRDEHYNYQRQKAEYINSLGAKKPRKSKK